MAENRGRRFVVAGAAAAALAAPVGFVTLRPADGDPMPSSPVIVDLTHHEPGWLSVALAPPNGGTVAEYEIWSDGELIDTIVPYDSKLADFNTTLTGQTSFQVLAVGTSGERSELSASWQTDIDDTGFAAPTEVTVEGYNRVNKCVAVSFDAVDDDREIEFALFEGGRLIATVDGSSARSAADSIDEVENPYLTTGCLNALAGYGEQREIEVQAVSPSWSPWTSPRSAPVSFRTDDFDDVTAGESADSGSFQMLDRLRDTPEPD